MPTAHITYLGEYRTNATHLQSGTTIITDAPTDNHGKGEAFSPTDLCATSLATCIITTMAIVGNRDGITLEGTEIDVTKIMTSEGPRRIAAIEVTLNIPAQGISDEQKQKLTNTAHTCPVSLALHPDIKQIIALNWL
jgi:uncharacterized OsmC-like protein